MSERLKINDVLAADLPDWRMIQNALFAAYTTGRFTAGLAFVEQIATAAEAANHHPDLTLTYPRVEVKLNSHDVDGVTERDLALARTISELAAAAGHVPETDHTIVDFGLDTAQTPAQTRFWAAVLDGSEGEGEVLGAAHTPDVWFQTADALPDPPPQRWHPDIWVPHDSAEARIKAALDAGGALVDDTRAPAFWVLADPEGNRLCICTNLER